MGLEDRADLVETTIFAEIILRNWQRSLMESPERVPWEDVHRAAKRAADEYRKLEK